MAEINRIMPWFTEASDIIADGGKTDFTVRLKLSCHPLFNTEEMKITLLKGYLLSHTRQNTTACKNIGGRWKTASWPNHIPLSAVRSSKPQLHMPQHTNTHTHTAAACRHMQKISVPILK